MKCLFLNHHKTQCGIFEFGDNIGRGLEQYGRNEWLYRNLNSTEEYYPLVSSEQPDIIVYNYYPLTMGWYTPDVRHATPHKKFGLVHETYHWDTDRFGHLFDYHIHPDPTLIPDKPNVFATTRAIPDYVPAPHTNDTLTIGSFGFNTPGKRFHGIIEKALDEYDEDLVLRFHMPHATFAGQNLDELSTEYRNMINRTNVDLQLTQNYMTNHDVINFLGQNDINCFFYDPFPIGGISSTIDYALAARKPLAVNSSAMFRHLPSEIKVENFSLKDIVNMGTEPLKPLYKGWALEELVNQYDDIVESA